MKKQNEFFGKARPRGEPFVWFTAMGLALGLVMVVSLLGLIWIRGIAVFWPKPVVLLEVNEDSQAVIGKRPFVAGEIAKKQQKYPAPAPDSPDAREDSEWQIFLGNKDVYGYSFKYFDRSNIRQVTYPADLMRMERREYGYAFGYPEELKLADGSSVKAGAPAFLPLLKDKVADSNQRWKKIREIEKDRIGKINYRMRKDELHKKTLLARMSADAPEVRRVSSEIADLEREYQVLAARARALREQQNKTSFVYSLASGQTKEIKMGDMISFYFPNQLSFGDRLQLFFRNLWHFLVEDPREANTEGGIFPAIFGTFVMTVLMSVAVVPFGVLAAIYLREYARQGPFVRCVRIAINNLAGVPSIVFGVFGLGFFVYFVGGTIDSIFFRESLPTPTFGTGGILWASLTLALLTVPVVIVATEESLASVPRGMREGSLACGASKWQTIQNIILPAAAPGIMTGLVLAMARGAGEVAPLMLVGAVKLAPNLPLDGTFPFVHFERKFMHLGFHIYDLGFQSPDSEAAKPMVFATTLVLISLVLLLNLGAIVIRERLRRKYAVGAF